MAKSERTIIVAIVSIIWMLIGTLIMLSGLFVAVIGFGLLGAVTDDFSGYFEEFIGTTMLAILGSVIPIVGAVIAIFGLLFFLLGYGLWKMSKVAWFISVILYGLGTLSLLSVALEGGIGILLAGGILGPVITIGLFIYFIMIRDKFD